MNMIVVEEHVSLLGPQQAMLGPIPSGSLLIARTAPGCWGPMITPEIPGGHEVSKPVAIEGAEPGDAVAIRVKAIRILSVAAASGTDLPIAGRYQGDAGVAAQCPGCGKVNPPTVLEGTGATAVRCAACGTPAVPFEMPCGYTMLFDEQKTVGVTVPGEVAESIAQRAALYAALPREARQHPATILGAADLVGLLTHVRPFIGNVGSCPLVTLPAAKNSRDLALRMVGAPHQYGLTLEAVEGVTDGHLDSDQVCVGSILIVPVKVPGAGIYLGDVHAIQGDGEIASHTVDVTAETTLEVELLKGVYLDGPVLLPLPEDLPAVVRPFTPEEVSRASAVATRLGFGLEEEVLPVQVIGTGAGLNDAVDTALERMSRLARMPLDEVRNRCTIAGGVEVARVSGVVQLSMLVPVSRLEEVGISHLVRQMYE